jgi:phosphonopyruvate decarboxylase
MMDPFDALRVLSEHRTDQVVVPTMVALRVWSALSKRPELDLPLVGCMGKASSLGLGLALARPDRQVWVIDGDGSLLMNLGTLVTIGNLAPPNLIHFVYNNSVYETTGGQPVPGAGRVDFVGLARAAGYTAAFRFDDIETLSHRLREVISLPGPTLVDLHVGQATKLGPLPPARRTAEALRTVKAALAGG